MAETKPRLGHLWVLIATILASSLSFIDGSVVNVGLPAIGKDLEGSAADLQWVINGYTLLLTVLLLLGGALGDRYGRRRLLVIGAIIRRGVRGLRARAQSAFVDRVPRNTGRGVRITDAKFPRHPRRYLFGRSERARHWHMGGRGRDGGRVRPRA